MGRQSSRIFFDGQDHKDIYFQGNYHKAMYLGSELVWEKLSTIKTFYFESGESGADFIIGMYLDSSERATVYAWDYSTLAAGSLALKKKVYSLKNSDCKLESTEYLSVRIDEGVGTSSRPITCSVNRWGILCLRFASSYTGYVDNNNGYIYIPAIETIRWIEQSFL